MIYLTPLWKVTLIDHLDEAELDRVIRIPTFHLLVPTKWELNAQVQWKEGEPPADVFIGGKVGQPLHDIPEPYHPADFLNLFSQPEDGEGQLEPVLTEQELQEALENIGLNKESEE